MMTAEPKADELQSEPGACLFLATAGVVLALSKSNGVVIWQTALPKAGYLVTLFAEGQRLFCASLGRVSALDSRSGEILWTNELKKLGSGFVNMATTANPNYALTEAEEDLSRNAIPPYGG